MFHDILQKANSPVTVAILIPEIAECYLEADGFWKQHAARIGSDGPPE